MLGGSGVRARGGRAGCDRSLDVVGRGLVCWMGGVCVLIFVFVEGIEAPGVVVTEGVVLDCGGGVGGRRCTGRGGVSLMIRLPRKSN